MHCVHKKRFVCFRIIRWLLASLRIVLSRLMYLTDITMKCFMYYVDFNLPPWYHNFCCDSNPIPLSLQRENENSFSLKTLWDKHDFFFKSLAISHNNSFLSFFTLSKIWKVLCKPKQSIIKKNKTRQNIVFRIDIYCW